MTTIIPRIKVFLRPILSDNIPTIGSAATDPIDCAAVMRPSLEPAGLPKKDLNEPVD